MVFSTIEIIGVLVVACLVVGGIVVLIRKPKVTLKDHEKLVGVVRVLGETQISQGETQIRQEKILDNHGEQLAEARLVRHEIIKKLDSVGENIAILLDRSTHRRKEDN